MARTGSLQATLLLVSALLLILFAIGVTTLVRLLFASSERRNAELLRALESNDAVSVDRICSKRTDLIARSIATGLRLHGDNARLDRSLALEAYRLFARRLDLWPRALLAVGGLCAIGGATSVALSTADLLAGIGNRVRDASVYSSLGAEVDRGLPIILAVAQTATLLAAFGLGASIVLSWSFAAADARAARALGRWLARGQ